LDTALDMGGVAPELRAGARALGGDVTAPIPATGSVDTVVHCAASVSFGLSLDDARRVNVDGTRHALDAAERAGARYVHVSTAYVAGRHRGVFAEDDLDRGQRLRNTYEQTKLEAELLVADARPDAVVLRPSIVVGESTTGWTSAFNVLYWPLRAFDRGLIDAVPARPGARVDVVPVDYVADAIAHVVLERPDVTGVLHLAAGHDAVTAAELVALAADALGRPRPAFTADGAALAGRSEELARYLPYFDVETVFDDARARAILDPAAIRAPALATYFDRLIAFAREAHWGKRAVTRPQPDTAASRVPPPRHFSAAQPRSYVRGARAPASENRLRDSADGGR
ncbi:MAG: SDR family oxidoreductase, partial [Actinomycetota bacterium]|nr:SDR family oxidoreductase [Actinomycetota bacterium]